MIVQRVAATLVPTYFLGLGPLGRPTRAVQYLYTTGSRPECCFVASDDGKSALSVSGVELAEGPTKGRKGER